MTISPHPYFDLIIYPVDENGKPVGPPLAPNTDGTVTIPESGVYHVEQHFSDAGKDAL